MRIVLDPALRGGDAHALQKLDRALASLLLGRLLVREHRLGDLKAGLQDRVERALGILEDHRDVAAANVADLLVAQLQQVLVAKQHLAADHLARVRHQPEQRQRRHRLAAT